MEDCDHEWSLYKGPLLMMARDGEVMERCDLCAHLRRSWEDPVKLARRRQAWAAAVLSMIASCAHLPHLDPKLRDEVWQRDSTVELTVTCAEEALPAAPNDSLPRADQWWINWVEPRAGSGTMVSDRHVVTGFHLVSCPVIPVVRARLPDGRVTRLVVTREDPSSDLALLEQFPQDNFNLGVTPPEIAPGTGPGVWCAALRGGRRSCGEVVYWNRTGRWFRGRTRDMDTGAGVYDQQGRLAGIVRGRDATGELTLVTPVGPEWLRGT